MKVSVLTLGCKVNKYESDSLLQSFKNMGYEISDKLEFADIYVVNTCAVTSEAEKKSRQMLARCRKFNPNAKIYVCGCASQKNPSQFSQKGAQFVGGTYGKKDLPFSLDKQGENVKEVLKDYEEMEYSHQSRIRAYIKVQDGCNNFCTYCIIPYLRGRSRSREMSKILDEAKKLGDEIKEIVVTGINVADFRIDGEKGFITLLEELDKLGKRIRLSSMEDGIIDENSIARLAKLKNFCPHFHLSLQSGCDTVLKRMNRHYTSDEFAHSVEIIRKYFPLAGITTDVIVGFPGESEDEFLQTLEFVKKVKFSQLHIFPYSHRTGTVASRMEDLAPEIKKDRARRLAKADRELQAEFIRRNNRLSVLIEEKEGDFFVGHSKNFIKCYISDLCEIGDVVNVNIEKAFNDGVMAKKV